MTIPRLCVAFFGGALAFAMLCYSVFYGSADAWRLPLTLIPALIVFIWWMVDRAALERRIRRLEVRSEIADERRITAQTNLSEVENNLHEIEDRVVDVENLSRLADQSQVEPTSLETASGTGEIPPGSVGKTIIIRLPVNPR